MSIVLGFSVAVTLYFLSCEVQRSCGFGAYSLTAWASQGRGNDRLAGVPYQYDKRHMLEKLGLKDLGCG